jgi:hypothetical protein
MTNDLSAREIVLNCVTPTIIQVFRNEMENIKRTCQGTYLEFVKISYPMGRGSVIPAKAGIQLSYFAYLHCISVELRLWAPACAGATRGSSFIHKLLE